MKKIIFISRPEIRRMPLFILHTREFLIHDHGPNKAFLVPDACKANDKKRHQQKRRSGREHN